VACTVSLEGRRPLVTEVQALVVPSGLAIPRRMAQDLDQGRLAILIAVLERRARVSFSGHDVFAATAGGVRLTEPAADLAVCLALASAARDWQVPADLAAFGEVGLGGEVRPVPQLERRLAEAARLGFRRALVPAANPTVEPLPELTVSR
jgi:DNA repair protein RadA/Sms